MNNGFYGFLHVLCLGKAACGTEIFNRHGRRYLRCGIAIRPVSHNCFPCCLNLCLISEDATVVHGNQWRFVMMRGHWGAVVRMAEQSGRAVGLAKRCSLELPISILTASILEVSVMSVAMHSGSPCQ